MTSDWKEYKLKDVCIKITDGVHNTVKDDIQGECYLLSCKNLKNNQIVISPQDRKISFETLQRLRQRTETQKGDVLLSSVGTIGETAIIKEFNPNYEFQRSVAILKPNTSMITSEYLFYFLNNSKRKLQHSAEGAVQQCLFINPLKEFKIDIPPLKTQQKIAKILSAIDDKIELNNSINNNLEQQAQALFYEIYNNGKCGTIGDILEIIETGSRPKGGALTHGVPSIGAENINGFGVYDYSKDKFISAEFYNKLNRGIVKSKDVLLYKDGAYTGKVSMTLDDFPHKQCAVNEHVFLLRTNKLATQFFLYFCLLDNSNRQKIHTLACGKAAQPGLNQNELKSVPIKIPNIEDIINFDITVTPIMKQIANNAKEKQKLAQLRDTLLPKLMSGEIDVSKVDISADKLLFNKEE